MLSVDNCNEHTLDEHLRAIDREHSLTIGLCTECGHINQKPFRPKKNMTENEQFLYDIYQTMPKFPAPKLRSMIPFKTDGVWHFKCEVCAK